MNNLSPQQFGDYELKYRDEDTGERRPRHYVEAYHQGEKVGSLDWNGSRGEINKIEVHDDHQRRGVATAMWNYAHSLKGVRKPKHSNNRSPAGDAWKRSVGGR